jgi:hypothetical protein
MFRHRRVSTVNSGERLVIMPEPSTDGPERSVTASGAEVNRRGRCGRVVGRPLYRRDASIIAPGAMLSHCGSTVGECDDFPSAREFT